MNRSVASKILDLIEIVRDRQVMDGFAKQVAADSSVMVDSAVCKHLLAACLAERRRHARLVTLGEGEIR